MEGAVPTDDQPPVGKPSETLVSEYELNTALSNDPVAKKHREYVAGLEAQLETDEAEAKQIYQSLRTKRHAIQKKKEKIKNANHRLLLRKAAVHRNLLFRKMIQGNRISPRTLGMAH